MLEVTPQLRRLGRGVVRRLSVLAVKHLDAANHAALGVRLVAVKNGAQHIRAGRLAFCTRNADGGELLVGMSRNARGRVGHGKAHVIHANSGYVWRHCLQLLRKRLLAEVRNSPSLHRACQIRWRETRALADKQRAGGDLTRIACNIGKLCVLIHRVKMRGSVLDVLAGKERQELV